MGELQAEAHRLASEYGTLIEANTKLQMGFRMLAAAAQDGAKFLDALAPAPGVGLPRPGRPGEERGAGDVEQRRYSELRRMGANIIAGAAKMSNEQQQLSLLQRMQRDMMRLRPMQTAMQELVSEVKKKAGGVF